MNGQDQAARMATRYWLDGLITDLKTVERDLEAAMSAMRRGAEPGERDGPSAPSCCWNALQTVQTLLFQLETDDVEPLPSRPDAAE